MTLTEDYVLSNQLMSFFTRTFSSAIAIILSVAQGFVSHPTVRLHRLNKVYSSAIPSETAKTSDNVIPEVPSVNIKFENIVNMRDLCTASSTVKVVPAKIFRTGCVSKASEADVSSIY
jgi:hypothetical protein